MKTVIIDNLEWQVDEVDSMTWDEAIKYASSLGDGWRLPTIKELSSLIDYEKLNPAINITYFPECRSSGYWSSSPDTYNSDGAWYVGFYNGYVGSNGKTGHYYVRCVRDIRKEFVVG